MEMQNPNLWMAREVLFPSDYKSGIDSQKERGRRERETKSGRKWSEPVPALSTTDKARLAGPIHISPICVVCSQPPAPTVSSSPLWYPQLPSDVNQFLLAPSNR